MLNKYFPEDIHSGMYTMRQRIYVWLRSNPLYQPAHNTNKLCQCWHAECTVGSIKVDYSLEITVKRSGGSVECVFGDF